MPRIALLILLCATVVTRAGEISPGHDHGDASADPRLIAAEAALAAGDSDRAMSLFEEAAAGTAHAPVAELGQARASLQLGEFRRAVSMTTLVAGEHKEFAEARALQAFLLDRAGQSTRALEMLTEERATRPDDVALLGAMAEIRLDRMEIAEAVRLLDEWAGRNGPDSDLHRLRSSAAEAAGRPIEGRVWLDPAPAPPTSSGASDDRPARQRSRWPATFAEPLPLPPAAVRAAGNGLVVDGGQAIVTTTGVTAAARGRIFVRNGLGRVREARLATIDEARGLALLRLDSPYPKRWSIASDTIGAPAGRRLSFILGFPRIHTDGFSQPRIDPGVVIRPDIGLGGLMQITNGLTPALAGSPVYDEIGRLVGLVAGPPGALSWVPEAERQLGPGSFAVGAAAIHRLLGSTAGAAAESPPGSPGPGGRAASARPAPIPATDELYERLAPAVVQIFTQL
jgi:S1-C subfamily serine protease